MKAPTFLLIALSLLATHAVLAQAGRSISSHNFRSQNAAQMSLSHQVRWAPQNGRFNLLTKKQSTPNTCLHQWMPAAKIVQNGNQQRSINGMQCQFCSKFTTQRWFCGNDPRVRQRLTIFGSLCQSWTHSREEEKLGTNGLATEQIFLPSNSRRFAPSRFRMRYVFNRNGILEYLYLHPTDRHHMKQGSWHLARDNKTVHWKNAEGGIGSFQILEITKDILRISSSKVTPPKAIWLTNFAQAKTQAAKEGKLILMEFTGSDWCGPCIALEKNVLSTDTFKQSIPGKFVLLKLDTPRDKSKQTPQEIAQYRTLSSQYKVRGVPTVNVTDPKGNERHRQVGYSSRQSAQQWVSNILKVAGP